MVDEEEIIILALNSHLLKRISHCCSLALKILAVDINLMVFHSDIYENKLHFTAQTAHGFFTPK